MKPRTWLLLLVTLSAPGFAQEPPKPDFDLKAQGVREAIRAHAVAPIKAVDDTSSVVADKKIPPLQFRAPRRVHHVECDSFACTAYTADEVALFSVPRDQYFSLGNGGAIGNGASPRENWLACQSGNDLLSTFERYDKCRGVTIGIPVQTNDVTIIVPLIGR
jgi:hypothetical protein